MGDHNRQDLFRYLRGDLSYPERIRVESHLKECGECSDFLAFVRNFNATLKEMAKTELQPDTPCPDPEMLVAFQAEELDEETARPIRQHTAFCKDCLEELYLLRQAAVASPEREAGQEPSKTDFYQEALVEGLSAFVSPNETYGAETFLLMAPTVLHGKSVHSRVREVSAGVNTYSVAMSVSPDGAVTCDIAGISTPLKTPLHVSVSSATRGDFISTKTDANGEGHLFVSAKLPEDVLLIFIFRLREEEPRSVSGARGKDITEGMMTALKALRRKTPPGVVHPKKKL